MIVKSKGIVFNHINYLESSIITTIYTENHGRLTFIINNARTLKSKIKVNIFQPLVLLDFDYYFNNKKQIHRIKEIRIISPFNSIPFNIYKCSIALFITEILDKAIKEEEPNKNLFEFIYDSVIALDSIKSNYSDFHIIFLMRLTKYLGFYPVNNYSEMNKFFNLEDGMFVPGSTIQSNCLDLEISRYFSYFISNSFSDLILTQKNRKMILESIIRYYYLHLHGIKEIKSLKVLNEIFDNNLIEQV
jgi:DNA repair protein RecO (recombination protein O)